MTRPRNAFQHVHACERVRREGVAIARTEHRADLVSGGAQRRDERHARERVADTIGANEQDSHPSGDASSASAARSVRM